MRVLVVTAVAAESDAVVRSLQPVPQRIEPYDVRCATPPVGELLVVTSGAIGPSAAAAAAATVLARRSSCDLVICAGIGGSFRGRGAQPGDVVVATEIVPADVGVQTDTEFLTAQAIGFGPGPVESPSALVKEFARRIEAAGLTCHSGPVLTLSTMTGTDVRADELAALHPNAVAEAMEGAGVAHVASLHGIPVVELRAISNVVGHRDRADWRLQEALDSLAAAFDAITSEQLP